MTCLGRILLIVAISALAARAEDKTIPLDQVPEVVKKAILAKYPNATLVEAEKEVEEGETTYEIGVEDGDDSLEFGVSAAGKILEVEKEIPPGKLPKAVADALKARYPGVAVQSAQEITRGETRTYEATLRIEGKDKALEFTPEGKVVEADDEAN